MCAARGISGGRFRCPPSACRRYAPTGSRADCHGPPLRSNGCRSYSGALGHSGLYDEVKAVFRAAETHVAPADGVTLAVLRAASTHWLRHGYARTLVVDNAAPLPVAQQLLGHAWVQTTAVYAKTDLAQTRTFVERSFATRTQCKSQMA
jgi:integrase